MRFKFFFDKALKAKDTPWDAVLMGSVVCTVVTKLQHLIEISTVDAIFFITDDLPDVTSDALTGKSTIEALVELVKIIVQFNHSPDILKENNPPAKRVVLILKYNICQMLQHLMRKWIFCLLFCFDFVYYVCTP